MEVLEDAYVTDQFVTLHASDKRDYIFGLLGLMNEETRTMIEPNCSKDFQVGFTEIAKSLLKHCGLRMLMYCQFYSA